MSSHFSKGDPITCRVTCTAPRLHTEATHSDKLQCFLHDLGKLLSDWCRFPEERLHLRCLCCVLHERHGFFLTALYHTFTRQYVREKVSAVKLMKVEEYPTAISLVLDTDERHPPQQLLNNRLVHVSRVTFKTNRLQNFTYRYCCICRVTNVYLQLLSGRQGAKMVAVT